MILLRLASDLSPLHTITATEPPAYDREADDSGFSFHFAGDSLVTRSGTVVHHMPPQVVGGEVVEVT